MERTLLFGTPVFKKIFPGKFNVYLFSDNSNKSEKIRLSIADALEGNLNCKEPAIVHWNTSDSEEWFAVACAPRPIGIDIEYMRVRPFQKLAERWFHPEEARLIEMTSDQMTLFYRLWVTKEAYWKMTKRGLKGNMKKIFSHRNIHKLEGLPKGLIGAVCTHTE